MSDSEIISPWQTPRAHLQWSETGEPFSAEFGDIYFSRGDGLAETEYVFLQQNRLAERWRALDPEKPGVFVIGETGFGSGLNFLCAWRLWRSIAPSNWRLHFVSIEKYPLDRSTLQRALNQWPQLTDLSVHLLDAYPPLVPGFHRRELGDGVTLQLLFNDAAIALDALCDSAANDLANDFQIDAWFLDGFAPAKNPQMWNDALFRQIGRLSGAATTFATFTVASVVKRGLQSTGFAIEKVPGFGAKRQMLRGDFMSIQIHDCKSTPAELVLSPPTETAAPLSTSVSNADNPPPRAIDYWAYVSNIRSEPLRHIAVIGGGLAGTSTAYALAKRGCRVTLLEQEAELANAASGNPQGVLYTKLSAQAGALNRFTLASYLDALAFYRALGIDEKNPLGELCGVLQLSDSDEQWLQLSEAFRGHDEWVQFVNAERATELSHCSVPSAALWFPQAGWLSPPLVCHALTQHPLISVKTDCRVTALQQENAQWKIDTSHGVLNADAVVIANASAATQFSETNELPLKSIRGQITHVPANYLAQRPATVICHEGYLTPSLSGATIGATFNLRDNETDVRADDHLHNLQTLHAALPSVLAQSPATLDYSALQGRVGFRCTTPDYLPIVGPVPDNDKMRNRFAALAKNAQRVIAEPGAYIPGLYVNVGHGSRGLTSTPLCAELLATLICNEPRPLPRDLVQALSPARFMIRKLIRG